MNVKTTREFFESNNVVAMRAYKSDENPQVERELVKLGNNLRAIPFYAIYGPELEKPITFDGLLSPNKIQSEIMKAMEDVSTK